MPNIVNKRLCVQSLFCPEYCIAGLTDAVSLFGYVAVINRICDASNGFIPLCCSYHSTAVYHSYADLDTVLSEEIAAVPRRFAISFRNRWMVNKREYMIAYVNHSFGGASQYNIIAQKKCQCV